MSMTALNIPRRRVVAATIFVAAAALLAMQMTAFAAPPITRADVEQKAKDATIDLCLSLQDEHVEIGVVRVYHCFSPLPDDYAPHWCDVGPPLRNDTAVCRGQFDLIPTDIGRQMGYHRHHCRHVRTYKKDPNVRVVTQGTECYVSDGG